MARLIDDGRWDRAYAGPATITVPEDLVAALAQVPGAAAAFEALSGQDRYAVLHRVHTATTPQTRAERIAAAVQQLAGPPGSDQGT
ncbi:YdeI/OmpD-associated family protein [Modestobacter sp. SYSU DS0290]